MYRIYGGSHWTLPSFWEAHETGIAGVVCSPQDLHLLDQIDPDRTMLRVCPGIRGFKDNAEDQKRTMTPAGAASEGANLLVVGRPVVGRTDYLNAANLILSDISSKN